MGALDLGPGLYVPFVADQRRLGTLVLGRVHGQPPFQPLDVAFAEVFAGAAATAIELGSVRSEIDRLSIIAEDERIARDLHDTVIQELFALGMSLQALSSSTTGAVGRANLRGGGESRRCHTADPKYYFSTSGSQRLREWTTR